MPFHRQGMYIFAINLKKKLFQTVFQGFCIPFLYLLCVFFFVVYTCWVKSLLPTSSVSLKILDNKVSLNICPFVIKLYTFSLIFLYEYGEN